MSAPLDDVDCLEMPDGTWAFTDGAQFWLHRPTPLQDLALTPGLQPVASAAHTRELLAAALAAGVARHRLNGAGRNEKPSLPRYIYTLAGNYHTTHATPFTMRHVGARLRSRGDETLARYCEEVADEETGHDRLVLADLEALGIRAEAFVSDVRPRGAMDLLALIRELADGSALVAVLGCAYALERFALLISRAAVEAVEAIVPRGSMATRGLRLHSAIGADARHVARSIDIIARLPAADRTAVVHATYETAALVSAPTDYPGDAAVDEIVARHARRVSISAHSPR
jgi:hypothetical protein